MGDPGKGIEEVGLGNSWVIGVFGFGRYNLYLLSEGKDLRFVFFLKGDFKNQIFFSMKNF